MKLKRIRQQVMISDEMNHWLTILEKKYNVKKCEFIRNAIKEKLQRDTPKMRLELNNKNLPF